MLRKIRYCLLMISLALTVLLLLYIRNSGRRSKISSSKVIRRFTNLNFHSREEIGIGKRKPAVNGIGKSKSKSKIKIIKSTSHNRTSINHLPESPAISTTTVLSTETRLNSRKSELQFTSRRASPDLVPGRKGPLVLLMWHHPWELTIEGPSEGEKAGDCTITYDRSKLEEASAVIFHFAVMDREPMPWTHYRHPDQLFIYYTMENPSFLKFAERRTSSQFDNHFINWTMSYRRDSEIYSSYFTDAKEILKDGKRAVDEILAQKSNLALWVASNCHRLPGAVIRMQLVDELIQAGLPVHRFGICFGNKRKFAELSPKKLNSYKFYFAFENSLHCRDYITEKLWKNGYKSGRVPVIWGPSKADVAALAPPGSYIHAEDFGSPALLAQYLLYLDKNATAYRQYFNWRVNPSNEVKRILQKHYLIGEEQLCAMLHKGYKRKTIKSVSHWMFATETKECLQSFP